MTKEICQALIVALRQKKMITMKVHIGLIFFLLFFVVGQAWSGDDFFFKDVDTEQLETALTNSDIVTRIRPVIPNVVSLVALEQGELRLNCFDDALMTVSITKQDHTVGGQTLWLGTINGVPHSYVLLVSNEKTISGEIVGPDFHYQIRPWLEDVHIVREMVRELSFNVLSKLSENVSFEAKVIILTNQERAANSLQALCQNDQLTISARGHATDMAANNYFDHTGQDGRSPFDRMTDTGYVYNSAGENIAAGQTTPAIVVNSWMNSAGHRANILSSTYCDIGVGYALEATSIYSHYWVQNFGRKLGVSECPLASTAPVCYVTCPLAQISCSGCTFHALAVLGMIFAVCLVLSKPESLHA